MDIHISSPRVEQLAREVIARTGESLTQALITALEERLERIRRRNLASDTFHEIMKISKRCRSLPDHDLRSSEDILDYNDWGIPL